MAVEEIYKLRSAFTLTRELHMEIRMTSETSVCHRLWSVKNASTALHRIDVAINEACLMFRGAGGPGRTGMEIN